MGIQIQKDIESGSVDMGNKVTFLGVIIRCREESNFQYRLIIVRTVVIFSYISMTKATGIHKANVIIMAIKIKNGGVVK